MFHYIIFILLVHDDTMFFQCLNSSEMLFYHYGDPMSIYILQVIEWPGENQYSFDGSHKQYIFLLLFKTVKSQRY